MFGILLFLSVSANEEAEEYFHYTVVYEDTIYSISRMFNITVSELNSLNNLTTSSKLTIGQLLKIPGTDPYPDSSITGPTADDVLSKKQLWAIGWRKNVTDAMYNDLQNCLRRFSINTTQRLRHFISQCSHESGCGKYTIELASGIEYEYRSDLGNKWPGDGPKFKGAGYLQMTGRANYQAFADFIGDQDVMDGHKYVAEKYPWTSAGFWWMNNKMNDLCDNPETTVENVTKKVNGGYNGLEERKLFYKLCERFIPAPGDASNITDKGFHWDLNGGFALGATVLGIALVAFVLYFIFRPKITPENDVDMEILV